jgi:4-amino-4-deoxy-L-arabinose transferase-like glycosyltransferase
MKLKFIQGLIIMLLLAAVPIFAHLDDLPLELWDESRLIGNALQMDHNGNYIVTYFNGNPDMWNTKPPLMIWLQVLCIKLLGMNELAGRLPSAIAALLTCLVLYWWVGKKQGNPLLGLLSCMVLITCTGLIRLHGSRTGDYDALLTLCVTTCGIYYYLYMEEGKGKYLTYSIASLTLAALTKGIAGLLILPALFCYTLYKRQLIVLLKEKRLYAGLGIFIFFVVGYYLLREHYNPGYLQAVQQNELGGRYAQVNEGHTGDVFFYLNRITSLFFKDWYLLLLPGLFFGLAATQKWLKDLTIFLGMLILSYLLILSTASTTIDWYIMPVYPFLAILAAIFIYTVYRLLLQINITGIFSFNPLPYVLIAFLFCVPYINALQTALTPMSGMRGEESNVANMAQYLKDGLSGKRNIDGFTITEAHPQNLCSYNMIYTYRHKSANFIHSSDFGNAKKVIAYRDDTKRIIDSLYYSHVLDRYLNVVAYQLDSAKKRCINN